MTDAADWIALWSFLMQYLSGRTTELTFYETKDTEPLFMGMDVNRHAIKEKILLPQLFIAYQPR